MAAKIALNKTALKQSRDKLGMYKRYLPSLDLKRQQLMLELQKARAETDAHLQAIEEHLTQAQDWIGLLANADIKVNGLVKVTGIDEAEQNLLGVTLPLYVDTRFALESYSMLANPYWVDALVEALKEVATLRAKAAVGHKRTAILEEAVRKITQRVNLFEKRLIPETNDDIRKIKIFLDDSDRASVIRAKFAKKKTLSSTTGGA
ncbi:V-type ATP synthase subunit D [Thiomicrorhabdus xiamenensis]|uniref:V-type ATP synthase subunit D n=1 Tax=Thiomicrorhabdus xiamenensis TaxID=2739063 RepID=A0A7D4P4K3_9GAMM|nr:V-type ATP synthase subunit D [Thiomicrorhabdus xiamenensis]QKI88955.1 V-type ATP synthase subunit D [Thiomicrorhabdus xiamenensis]